jgi:hypothetical protein
MRRSGGCKLNAVRAAFMGVALIFGDATPGPLAHVRVGEGLG